MLVSVIIFQLLKPSSTHAPEGNKENYSVLIQKSFFGEKKLPLIENLRIKLLSCFNHQINITVVLLSYEILFH